MSPERPPADGHERYRSPGIGMPTDLMSDLYDVALRLLDCSPVVQHIQQNVGGLGQAVAALRQDIEHLDDRLVQAVSRLDALSQQRTSERRSTGELKDASYLRHDDIIRRYRHLVDQTLVGIAGAVAHDGLPETTALCILTRALFEPGHEEWDFPAVCRWLHDKGLPNHGSLAQAYEQASWVRQEARDTGHAHEWRFRAQLGIPLDEASQRRYDYQDSAGIYVAVVLAPSYVVEGEVRVLQVVEVVETVEEIPAAARRADPSAGRAPAEQEIMASLQDFREELAADIDAIRQRINALEDAYGHNAATPPPQPTPPPTKNGTIEPLSGAGFPPAEQPSGIAVCSSPGPLSNPGAALRSRFERSGVQADLDDAVTAARDAAAATPADHPDRAMYLSNLGSALCIRFERMGELADLDAAVEAGRAAAEVKMAPPRVRAIAARDWGRAAASGKRWPVAVAGFEAAISLLGRMAPRSLVRADQEHLLTEMAGLAADAAACCVRAGLTDRAVELFDQGRGVLLGQALDIRTDLTALADRHPEAARRFTDLCEELDRVHEPTASGMPPREAAVAEFDRLIAEIRELPGFGDFLQPPPVAQLRAAATGGAVVVVAVSSFGSYALLLTGAGVDPVPLPGLTPECVYERVVGVLDALAAIGSPAAGADAERRLDEVLGWLWDALAGPVLARLGIHGPPEEGEPWPRMWWCTSGLLSFLPVHAAGHHDTQRDPAPATVIDRVISSYTPTIRALTHARRPFLDDTSGNTAGGGGRVVAVAMGQTPGATDLSGAHAEVEGLAERLPGQVRVFAGPEATHDAVLAALPDARWVHFACHGMADPADPSASHLLLHDHQTRPLRVVDVARLRLAGAELAVLSACATARPGARLTDEAIQVASAFQLAAYRHVVATLWPVREQLARRAVAAFYDRLATAGEYRADRAPFALHDTTLYAREQYPDHPSIWAAFVHAGS
ncbi:CHAT domain-containing protein [Frankia sp. Cj3]|uniref:CHAT domain-containing protein n=1 Tax=Frankia sp. Cj3 TaxID=2880976 RepID=UPI001EF4E64C|nr:CHAT domain-containing protein [Frankia sp. Cj3]